VTISEDESVLRRARPLLEEAVGRQEPATRAVLGEAREAGDLAVDYVHDAAGQLRLVWSLGGYRFCDMDARNVGLHEVGGEVTYVRDVLLDDDVE
jgi:hypothetical protein